MVAQLAVNSSFGWMQPSIRNCAIHGPGVQIPQGLHATEAEMAAAGAATEEYRGEQDDDYRPANDDEEGEPAEEYEEGDVEEEQEEGAQ